MFNEACFICFCLPPHGLSGGMLIGINMATIQVKNMDVGDFCVKLYVKSKFDGFEWALVSVYGAAQDDKINQFLAEFVRMCENEPLPLMAAGDFNIIRRPSEKTMIILNLGGRSCLTLSLRGLGLRKLRCRGANIRRLVGGNKQ